MAKQSQGNIYEVSKMNQVILILEGLDKTGKSFLARALNKSLNVPIYKGTSAPKTKEELRTLDRREIVRVDLNTLHEFLKQTQHSVIIDRLFLSELVYSKVYHRPVDEAFLWDVDKQFAELGTIVIYCMTTPEHLKKRFVEEKIVNINNTATIMSHYAYALTKTQCAVIRYLSEATPIDSVVQQVADISSKYHRLNALKEGGHA